MKLNPSRIHYYSNVFMGVIYNNEVLVIYFGNIIYGMEEVVLYFLIDFHPIPDYD